MHVLTYCIQHTMQQNEIIITLGETYIISVSELEIFILFKK